MTNLSGLGIPFIAAFLFHFICVICFNLSQGGTRSNLLRLGGFENNRSVSTRELH
jgi:hypothetical protein